MRTFGFTLPQRGVFLGVTTVPQMLSRAAQAADEQPLLREPRTRALTGGGA
jgi:hypothetical protein